MAHLEGAYEQINHRLGTVEQRLSNVENKIDEFRTYFDKKLDDRVDDLRDLMERRFAQVDQKFLWVIGLIVVSILIPIAERFVAR